MLRRLIVACALIQCATSGTAQAIEHLEPQPATQELMFTGEASNGYHMIPRKKAFIVSVEGPGVLGIFLVNLRSAAKRQRRTSVQITIDGRPEKQMNLGCGSSPRTFESGQLLPCAEITREVTIPAGKHGVGLRLTKTTLGALAHFVFATAEEVRANPDWLTQAMQKQIDAAPALAELSIDALELEPMQVEEPTEEEGQPPAEAITNLPQPEQMPKAQTSRSGRWSNPWLWTGVGATLASAGVGTYFGIMSRKHFKEGRNTNVRSVRIDKNDSGKSAAILANVFFAVAGAAGLASGLILVLDLGVADKSASAKGTVGSAWQVSAWLTF